jgi:UDPglucose--hexose-1-phosphate uridylyltransferase
MRKIKMPVTNDKIHQSPHRRYNPLNDKWILVSPQRNNRPWNGKTETLTEPLGTSYDKECYLCPGNIRASGLTNNQYNGCYIFDNDYAAIQANDERISSSEPLFKSQTVNGACKVICYSPDHSKTLPELELNNLIGIINAWRTIYTDLEEKYKWVQIFENKGEINGCSNPHPHGQVWASSHLPDEVERENKNQQAYYEKNNRPLLLDYLEDEIEKNERIVCLNDDWVVLVPYWAAWPFETLLLPRTPISHMNDLKKSEIKSLAKIIKSLTTRYDNLFNTSFPYSMGWHCRPAGERSKHWIMHGHFYPPLLRSATVQKFMVGYELLGETQRDISAELASNMLRQASDVHYKKNPK